MPNKSFNASLPMLGTRTGFLALAISITILASYWFGPSRTFLPVLTTVLSRSWPLIPLALAASLVISSGDIDLSPAGAFSFLGMLVLWLNNHNLPVFAIFLITFAISIAVGLVHGTFIGFFKAPPLIMTLGTSFFMTGIAILIYTTLLSNLEPTKALPSKPQAHESNTALISATPTASTGIASYWPAPTSTYTANTLPERQRVGIFSVSYPWTIAIIIILVYWKQYTLIGLKHMAVGSSREGAILAGLDVRRIRATSFFLASLLTFLSAMLYLIDYNGGGWSAGTGGGLELTGIAAAVIGGTSVSGGRFEPVNVALAMILWVALHQLSIALPFVGPTTQMIAIGILLILVANLDRSKEVLP